MNHLDVVTSTLVTNPLTASLAIALGRDALEDVFDVRPCGLVTTGHDRGTVTGTLLTTGDTGADKSETLGGQVFCSAVGVGEMRVTTIDDDIALLQEGQEDLDPVVHGLTSLDEQHDAAGALELGDELLVGVGTNNGLALGLVLEEMVDLGHCSVVGADSEAVIGHVQNKVLAPIPGSVPEQSIGVSERNCNLHDGQTDEAQISAFMIVSTASR